MKKIPFSECQVIALDWGFGLMVYLAALKNGAILAAHPYHVIYS